jgi:hypothetical protein
MGICSGTTIISTLLILTGIISAGSIITSGVSIVKHFNDYSCANLNYGILLGSISSVIFILNLLLYSISCVKKSSLIIPSICIIGSVCYNGYLITKIDETCDTYYHNDNKKLWEFYIYYLISLIVEIVLIGTIIIYNCCKNKIK